MSRAAVGRERATRGLFERWQRDKDPRARECLVECYLPLARNVAARYRDRGGEPFDDLLQVASLGLLKALDRFDPDRGTAFSSFAVPTILGELKRYFRDTGWSAHVPRGAQELALKVQGAEHAISPRLGRSPTADELALYMEVSVEQVIDGLEAAAAHHATSLEEPHDELDGESRSLADAFGEDDPRFEQIDASLTVASAARELSEREQRVLELRFYGELTQSEIAKRIGVSQMQVSRILRGALAHLRELALAEYDPHQPVKSAGTEDGNPGAAFSPHRAARRQDFRSPAAQPVIAQRRLVTKALARRAATCREAVGQALEPGAARARVDLSGVYDPAVALTRPCMPSSTSTRPAATWTADRDENDPGASPGGRRSAPGRSLGGRFDHGTGQPFSDRHASGAQQPVVDPVGVSRRDRDR